MEKKEIRKLFYRKRKEQSLEALEKKSQIICQQILDMEAFRKADTIYDYMDCKGDVST